MSIDQRKLIGEATQWILRIALAIASFLMVSDFNEFKGDMKEVRKDLINVRERVIRLETKIDK